MADDGMPGETENYEVIIICYIVLKSSEHKVVDTGHHHCCIVTIGTLLDDYDVMIIKRNTPA